MVSMDVGRKGVLSKVFFVGERVFDGMVMSARGWSRGHVFSKLQTFVFVSGEQMSSGC